ncbi:MAG: 4Fe-4S binding protein [Thermodesulfobacteriota bacterium]|nr:4Fe-4S binding protein [Thermodesulfobacteriota bacterium]
MNIALAKLVYFSPTKTTKTIIEGIAQGIRVETVEQIDLTPPEAITQEFEGLHDELAIIGSPVYVGRIPIDAALRLQRIKADNTPAVIVVVYGNRQYEDALLELRDLAVQAGFKPVAGGAFIGEHSFANDTMPIANGRPDPEDLKKTKEFGTMILKQMRNIRALDEMPPLHVPGNFPYRKRGKLPETCPVTQEALCVMCGECAKVCPTAAITVEDRVMTDEKACILCCACVKNCPTRARVIEEPRIKHLAESLSTNCHERKEPEMYL